jgi:hypothetical protein
MKSRLISRNQNSIHEKLRENSSREVLALTRFRIVFHFTIQKYKFDTQNDNFACFYMGVKLGRSHRGSNLG